MDCVGYYIDCKTMIDIIGSVILNNLLLGICYCNTGTVILLDIIGTVILSTLNRWIRMSSWVRRITSLLKMGRRYIKLTSYILDTLPRVLLVTGTD